MPATLNEDYVIQRNGKRMVLYAGLLDAAHQEGLEEIDTALVQAPEEHNRNVAIVHATVVVAGRKFTGIGDASPQNVGNNIVPHIIRMAETRAKARAMRDAVNVGELAADESDAPEYAGRDDDLGPPQRYPGRPRDEYRGTETGATAKRGGALKPDDPAPDHLKNRLREMIFEDEDWADVMEWEESHKPIPEMTVSEVAKAINAFS